MIIDFREEKPFSNEWLFLWVAALFWPAILVAVAHP